MSVVSSLCFENRRKMDAVHGSWICVLLLFIGCTYSAATECTIRQHNSTDADHAGEKKLLELLKPLNGKKFQAKDENYTYTFGFCTKADNKSADGVGLMQYANSGIQNFSLGRYDAVGIMGGHDWVFLTYYHGEKYHKHCNLTERTSHIMVVCNPDVFVSNLRVLEERRMGVTDDCFYLFEIGTNVICDVKSKEKAVEPPHSLSSGSVFCIIFFTCAGIYLLLGFLYQRIVVGGKGLEQIPNYSFWRSFGNLQADGCDYVCRSGPRQESHAYRGIDDRIRTDEERDDQLLNM